jgi:hypothetical protein
MNLQRGESGGHLSAFGCARALRVGGILLVGILMGVIAMGVLAGRALRAHREVIRIEYATKQDFLASRAARRGEHLAELVHRWNGVEMRSSDRGAWVAEERSFWKDLTFPLAAPILEAIKRATDPEGRGQRLDEALHRSMLALVLEKLGQEELAADQWSAAVRLSRRSQEHVRSAAEALATGERSGEHLISEEIVLGTESVVAGPSNVGPR